MQKQTNFVNAETKDKRTNAIIRFFKGDYGINTKKTFNKTKLIKALKEDDLLDHFNNSSKFEI